MVERPLVGEAGGAVALDRAGEDLAEGNAGTGGGEEGGVDLGDGLLAARQILGQRPDVDEAGDRGDQAGAAL